MVSKKQHTLIAILALYGFLNAASNGGLAYMAGSAFGMAVIGYALVLGYNGVSPVTRLKQLAGRTD